MMSTIPPERSARVGVGEAVGSDAVEVKVSAASLGRGCKVREMVRRSVVNVPGSGPAGAGAVASSFSGMRMMLGMEPSASAGVGAGVFTTLPPAEAPLDVPW
jgi:hypothetical protein